MVLLHGWPGDRTDYRELVPLLSGCEVVVPDLRGFGDSDKHAADPAEQYSGAAQARSVADLITSLGMARAVVVGLRHRQPDRAGPRPVAPGPGPRAGDQPAGARGGDPRLRSRAAAGVLVSGVSPAAAVRRSFIDGNPDAVRAYLRHFWGHWSGPDFTARRRAPGPPGLRLRAARRVHRLGAVVPGRLRDRGGGPVPRAAPREDRLATPAIVLWPEHDPLFPREWSDRVDEFFAAATLQMMPGVGHFSPLEAPETFATAIRAAAGLAGDGRQ